MKCKDQSLPNDFQLARDYLHDGSWWYPTIDVMCLRRTNPEHETELFWYTAIEEVHHRTIFLETEARLWMAWVELLSTCEFLSLLRLSKNLQAEKPMLSIGVPLSVNLYKDSFPSKLKSKIRIMVGACNNIGRFHLICEPYVEAFALHFIGKHIIERRSVKEIEFWKRILQCKLEKSSSLSRIYPSVKKICELLANPSDMHLASRYVFSPMTQKDRINFPPLETGEALRMFNTRSAIRIKRRFDIVEKMANSGTSRNKLKEFLEASDSRFDAWDYVRNNDLVFGKVDKIRENYPQLPRDLIRTLSIPATIPFVLHLYDIQNAVPFSKLYPYIVRHKIWNTIFVQKKNVRWLPEFQETIQNAILSSLEITYLKYYFLSGIPPEANFEKPPHELALRIPEDFDMASLEKGPIRISQV